MKKISTINFLMVFSLFFCFRGSLNALSEYNLDEDSVERVAQEINAKYPEVPYPTLFTFLSGQFNYQSLSTLVPMPSDFTFFAQGKEDIQFKWKENPQQDLYLGSYLNLERGSKGNFSTQEPDLCLHLDKGYQMTLYAFVAVHEDLQSIVKIIIVDRDVFFNASCGFGPSRNADAGTGRSDAASFPNPFYGQTTIGFELEEEGSVLVNIYASQSPVALKELTSHLFLSEGRHEIPLDLSHFPAGHYYVLIQSDQQVQYIPLLHLKE